jgi:hypothetical protein
MSGVMVATILGVIVSIVLEAVPGLADWWSNWAWKRVAWLAGSFVVSFSLVGLAYAGAPVGFEPPDTFIWDGLFLAIGSGVAAYVGGQVSYAVVSHKLRPVDVWNE